MYAQANKKKVFCIGNGESRKDFNLNLLRPFGKIYGCNAIYRNFTPDVLCAVDHGMIHEIYHKGVANQIPCYFRNWTKIPITIKDDIIKGLVPEDEHLTKEFQFIKENKQPENCKEIVVHGSNLSGIVNIIKREKKQTPNATNEIIQKKINKSQCLISYIDPNGDKAKDLRDIMEGKDRGWACGATSGYVACRNEVPDEVYLIGHDLFSVDGKVNNLYKGTEHYVIKESGEIPAQNWIDQWLTLFKEFVNIKFIKVNEFGVSSKDKINREILEWAQCRNLEYITQEELIKRLK